MIKNFLNELFSTFTSACKKYNFSVLVLVSTHKHFLSFFQVCLSYRKFSMINSRHTHGLMNFSHTEPFPATTCRCHLALCFSVAILVFPISYRFTIQCLEGSGVQPAKGQKL